MSSRMENWVNQGDGNFIQQRQAIHAVLLALCKSADLRNQVYLKGGLLLGIGYGSCRYTTDIDISNEVRFNEGGFDKNIFDANLRLAMADLHYGLRLKTQSVRTMPKKIGSFNSYRIKVGYAVIGNGKEITRLENGNAIKTIKIDYSFNEGIHDESRITIFGDEEIKTYGIYTLLAEKYRAILQQVVRNRGNRRGRRQDIFDLHYLITEKFTEQIDKKKLRKVFIDKCNSRELTNVGKESFNDPEVKKRASTDYDTLQDEIVGDLPDFNKAFDLVKNFYVSLFDVE